MGGGVMRTAAKAAAIGGYRSVPLAEHATASAWRASVSAASVPAREGVPAISDSAQVGAPLVSSVQRPSWEVEDWVFTGVKEEDLFDSLHPAPRLVFGPIPTLEEAKEATSDLKNALEKTYLSSTATSYDDSAVPQRSTSSGTMCLETLEFKMSAAGGSAAILPSTPKHVMQTFSLLQASPEAQNVVASLASDKNVWDAVMKNEKVMEFYKSHPAVFLPPGKNVDLEESDAGNGENKNNATPERSATSSLDESSESSENSVMHTFKLKVSEMVSNLSDFFQDLLGTSTETGSSTATKTATANDSYIDVALGASFLALAIAVILVVLVKRG